MKIALIGTPVSHSRISSFTEMWSHYLPNALRKEGVNVEFIETPRVDLTSEDTKISFLENIDTSSFDHVIALELRYFSYMPKQETERLRLRVKGCLGQIYDGGMFDNIPVDLTFTFRNDDRFYPCDAPNNRYYRHHAYNKYIGWAADEQALISNKSNDELSILVDHASFNHSQKDLTLSVLLNIKNLIAQKNIWNTKYKSIKVRMLTDNGIIEPDLNNIKVVPFKRTHMPFTEIASEYSRAHLYMVTHVESVGLTVLETAIAGALPVVPKGYVPADRLETVRHVITDGAIDWKSIIDQIDPVQSVEVARKNSWTQVARNMIGHLQEFQKDPKQRIFIHEKKSFESKSQTIGRFRVRDQNIDALVFEPKSGTASTVVVSFSAMNRESNYDRWSWFHRRHEKGDNTLFVVFKDDDKLYYLGSEDQPMNVRYKRFLNRYLEKFGLNMNAVYAVGSSMGGYAALYYSFLYGFAGVCVTNPQIDYQSTRRHEFYNWEKQIRLTGEKFEDLTDFIFRAKGCPRVFLGHSNYPADRQAADRFIAALHEGRISYIREYSETDAHSDYNLTEDRLFNLISYWRNNEGKTS